MLLADIDAAEAAPPQALRPGPRAFVKVYAEGTIGRSAGLYGSDVRDTAAGPTIGAYLMESLGLADGRTVLVNRGWVPTDGAIPAVTPGPARIEGYVRAPDQPGLFSAKDDPGAHRFYTLDPGAIGPALGVPDPAPYTLVELGTPQPGVYPQPADALPRPPNDHLSYAITWFSLAITALVISVLQLRRMRRT